MHTPTLGFVPTALYSGARFASECGWDDYGIAVTDLGSATTSAAFDLRMIGNFQAADAAAGRNS